VRTIQTARPRGELKEFVRVFALREMTCSGSGFIQPDIACLEHILAFEFCDPIRIDYVNGESKLVPKIHVAGSQTFPSGCAYFTGRHFAFGIFLKPLASWQLFRIPLATLANDNFDGKDLLGNGIHTLWLRLAESKTFEQRIKVAEDYLIPFAMNARAQTAIMKSARQMFRYKGAVRVEDLAHHSGLSLRQYERRFATEIGFAPKLFARITRFQAALDTKRLSPRRSWLSVAHELGYFDQMHMVRDFQSLGGDVPSHVIQQSGDLQPWSVASPEHLYDFGEPRSAPVNRPEEYGGTSIRGGTR
jgi:AraC-like DNA-binding protein